MQSAQGRRFGETQSLYIFIHICERLAGKKDAEIFLTMWRFAYLRWQMTIKCIEIEKNMIASSKNYANRFLNGSEYHDYLWDIVYIILDCNMHYHLIRDVFVMLLLNTRELVISYYLKQMSEKIYRKTRLQNPSLLYV
jgi:hypothetical protein